MIANCRSRSSASASSTSASAQRVRRAVLLVAGIVLASWPLAERTLDGRTLWNQPFQPFRVIGNIYYVGAANLSVFLIVTPAGSVLLDGGLRETAPQIARNVASLGFRLTDVKYLLATHAHYDHAGGLAELKRRSGALVVASSGDAPGFQMGNAEVPPVAVDRVIGDGETLRMGDTTLTAHVTPGHTQGCVTWTMVATEHGRAYRVLFFCGSTSIFTPLVRKPRYPGIAADYERSFRVFRALPSDVFLPGHPDQFDMYSKRKKMRPGAPNPFVDPTELGRFVGVAEARFREELEKERSGFHTGE